MDLSGHENSNSNNNRPDLTIPMPSSFVAGAAAAMAAAVAAAAQQDSSSPAPVKAPPPNPVAQSLKISSSQAPVVAIPPSQGAPGGVVVASGAANNGNAAANAENGKDAKGSDASSKKPVRYRECLKNHAAGIGGHALDGCGEFMPNKEDETSLRCAACDCHRNFHRREVEGEKPICDMCKEDESGGTAGGTGGRGPGGTKRLADYHPMMGSGAAGGTPQHAGGGGGTTPLKKRFRTKFTNEQKERMFVLSEKLGWRIQKHDEAEVAQFCADTGVKRHVLKVWMHNNKHTFGNKRMSPTDVHAPHEPT